MKRIQWFLCWAAYRLYRILPVTLNSGSRYWRFNMWLVGYAGAYAHSENYEWFCEHVSLDNKGK